MTWLKPLLMSIGVGGVVSLAIYALMEARDEQEDEGCRGAKKTEDKKKEITTESNASGLSTAEVGGNRETEYIKNLRKSAQDRSPQRRDRILPTDNWRK